ncbi:MAG: ATP-dependent dethiobiotin synthetase BioD, partial [Planctomycetaceae bacterium]
MPIPGIFIVGTDTGVGKTYVTALLIREYLRLGFRVGAYKPACSGAEILAAGTAQEKISWPDIDALTAALGRPELAERVCPQRFRAAAAPPVAARLEGRSVDRRLL